MIHQNWSNRSLKRLSSDRKTLSSLLVHNFVKQFQNAESLIDTQKTKINRLLPTSKLGQPLILCDRIRNKLTCDKHYLLRERSRMESCNFCRSLVIFPYNLQFMAHFILHLFVNVMLTYIEVINFYKNQYK